MYQDAVEAVLRLVLVQRDIVISGYVLGYWCCLCLPLS